MPSASASSRSAKRSRTTTPATLATEPDIPWRDVAGMRDQLTHRYFDTAHAIVQATIDDDLPPLVAAAERLLSRRRRTET